jgi:PAS domain S-box-containing protein
MSEATTGERKGRILIVDDSPENLQLLLNLLTAQGYRVHAARSGDLALHFVRVKLPDLILLDILMPEMDGFQVCQRLKADERTSDIPIIFLSAVDQAADKVRAFAAGGVDYIVKPFQADEVLARIETHLSLRSRQRRLEEQVGRLSRALLELAAIFDNASVGIVFTRDRVIKRCNQRAAEIFGYGVPADLIGKPGSVFYPDAESYERIGREAGPSLAAGRSFHADWLLHKANGRPVWVNLYGKAVDPARTDQGTVWIVDDITESKQTEAALHQTLREVAAIMQNAPVSIIFTRDRRMVRYNPKFAEMYGFKGDEGVGLPARLLYRSDEEYDALGRQAAPRLSQGQPFQTELWMRRQDGTDIWVNLIGYVVNPENPPEGTIWISEDRTPFKQAEEALQRSRDELERRVQERTAELSNTVAALNAEIAERKRAEEALRESEARFRGLTETVPAAITIVQGDRIRYANAMVEQLTGYTRAELFNIDFWNLVRPDHQTLVRERARGRQRGEPAPIRYELPIVTKNGEQRWFDISVKLIEFEGQPASLTAAYDITERKQAEEAQRRYAQRLKNLQAIDRAILAAPSLPELVRAALLHLCDLLPCQQVSVVLFDFEQNVGRVLFAHACEGAPPDGADLLLKDYGLHELLTETPRYVPDLAAPGPRTTPSAPARAPFLERRFAQGFRSQLDVPLYVGADLIGLLSLSATLPAAFAAEHVDIAQEVAAQLAIGLQQARLHNELQRRAVELEQRVAERTAELAAANQELEAFSYSVSHDLRAPLRAIDGFARVVLDEHTAQLDPGAQRYLRRVREGAQRMGHLIDDLLAFSRLSRQPVHKTTVVTYDLVQEVLDELRPEYEHRQVEIHLGELSDCQADPALLRQVWMNLLSNALKYTRGREVARIEIGSHGVGDQRTFFVKDNGVGMDMHYADKLFGVFQRFHRREEFEGTGVGLAIVQRIIQRHGGRVWAESAVGQGATFYFTLPEAR